VVAADCAAHDGVLLYVNHDYHHQNSKPAEEEEPDDYNSTEAVAEPMKPTFSNRQTKAKEEPTGAYPM